MFLGNGIRYRQNSDGYPHIFDHGLVNGDVADIARRQTTSVIQDGGLQTGSRMFLWNGMRYQRNSNGYPHIFDHGRTSGDTADVVRHQRTSDFKMADSKPEVECFSGTV